MIAVFTAYRISGLVLESTRRDTLAVERAIAAARDRGVLIVRDMHGRITHADPDCTVPAGWVHDVPNGSAGVMAYLEHPLVADQL